MCVPISLLPALTFTCSLEVTAQKTISVKPWVGNMRKQMPPITRPSLISARVLCFLRAAQPRVRGAPHAGPPASPSHARVKDEASDVLLGHAGQLVREDILQPHQPHQDLLVGFLRERVADNVELDDATALLQPRRLIPRRVGRQQAGLGAWGGHCPFVGGAPLHPGTLRKQLCGC